MKKLSIAFCCICIFISCAKKTVPSKAIIEENTTTNPETEIDSVSIAPTMAVMVVADGYGRLITPKQNLPQDAGIKYNSLQLSKSFTVQQRSNLQARYHTVPPRVLYVSEQYRLHSLKGIYYIYRKKFWYWKRSDGLFYLDQKYYL